MARAGVALSILLLGASVPAAAGDGVRWSASGDVGAGGGYDSNAFLQVAASPDSPNFHPYAGGFLRLDPALEGAAAGDGYRLALRYGADLVQTFGSGRLALQDGELSLTLPELGPVGVRLAATAGRFDASDFASDRFWTWGGRAGATVRLAAQLHVSVIYEIERRVFGDPTILMLRSDLAHVVRLRADTTPTSALSLGAGVEYLTLRSNLIDATQAIGQLTRWRADAVASYRPHPAVTLGVSLWAGTLAGDGVRTDLQAGAGLGASLRTGAVFDVVVRYDLLVDRARDGGSDYARQVLSLMLVGHLTVARPQSRPSSTASEGADVGAGPAAGDLAPAVDGGRVRFRLRAPGATRVVVIGSWNDWRTDDPAQRLRRAGTAGTWEGWVTVGPGQHRYQFLVDGRPVRPVDAARYRPDGFGGQDAVVEVAPDGGAARSE